MVTPRSVVVVWFCGLLTGSSFAGVPEIEMTGAGRVVGVDLSGGSITLEHGRLGELLPAGRTSFPIRARELLQHVRLGDEVAFVLTTPSDTHGELVVSSIRVLPREVSRIAGTNGVAVRDLAAALVVLLLGIAVGVLWVQSRRLRRLVEGSETVARELREAVLRNSGVEAAAIGLLPALRRCQLQIQERGERIQATLSRVEASQRDDRWADLSTPELPRELARPTVIVRRGEVETFRSLDERLGKPGLARVAWDRRRRERRSTGGPSVVDRRRRERRSAMSVTWQGLGYVVVPPKAGHLTLVS